MPAKAKQRFSESMMKLYIWNMTQYNVALWLDSDTMVLKSLQPLLDLSARLPFPGSREKGPRYFCILLLKLDLQLIGSSPDLLR